MRIALLATLLLSACRCDDEPPPVRKAQALPERTDEALLAQLPKIEGSPIEPSALATVLPSTLGDAAAEGEVKTESTLLANEGSLSIARRVYVKDGQRITVQVTDMLHAPLLRQIMIGAKAKAEQSKSPSWKAATVQGHDAVTQYVPTQQAAMANIVATDRLFVNVRVEPAENAERAIEWANKLPLEPITKLLPPEPAGAPAQPPPL